MVTAPGTLERIAVELAQAVGSLRHWVETEQVLELLAEFGVQFPDELLVDPTFSSALAELQAAVESLDEAADAMDAALADQSGTAVLVAAAIVVVDTVRQILDSAQSFSDAIRTTGQATTDVPVAQIDQLVENFPQKLLHFLLVEQLDIIPVVGEILTLMGLIDRVEHDNVDGPVAEPPWTERSLHLDRIGRLLTDPTAFFEEKYGWGGAGFDGARLFDEVARSLSRLGVPSLVLDDPETRRPTLEALVLNTSLDSGTTPPGLSLTAISDLTFDLVLQQALPVPSWTFAFSGGGRLQPGNGIAIRPPLRLELQRGDGSEIELELSLSGFDEHRFLLLGQSTANGLSAKGIDLRASLELGDNATGDPLLSGSLSQGRLAIDASEADGFVASLLGSSAIASDFDLGFTWSLGDGLRFDGGVGLARDIDVGLRLGPIEIPTIHLAVAFDSTGTLSSEFTASLATDLGVFALNVDHIGLGVDLAFQEDGSGNAGPLQLEIAFRSPDGLGLSVGAEGVVTGGGYLSFDAEVGRYSGVLMLDILDVGISAIGLVETKLPDNGWSMFLSLFLDLPSIQLGFGFTLNGVGGLVGVHRGLDEDALADAVRSGSLDDVLFPEDPVADATRIIAEIEAIFPTAQDQFVFGPVAKIGWGTPTLIELDIGIAIQLPEPLTISLLGALNAVLPDEDAPILVLNVAFAGTANITEGTLKIDASLTGSQVAGFLITGDMSVRMEFFGRPSFLVAFGGFHPAFDPPASFPRLERLGISLDTGDTLQLSLGGYFALSSNSIQFGSFAHVYISELGFTAEGGTSFDALVIYRPFSVAISMSAWVSISAGRNELLCVLLEGNLTGPNPWHVAAAASFKILGIKQSINLNLSFGDRESQAISEQVDVQPLLAAELMRDDAWSVLSPAGNVPVIAAVDTDTPALDPAGRLQVGQRIVPLDRRIDRYGDAALIGADSFSITIPDMDSNEIEDMEDWFGSEHYFRLDQDERLSAPSFTLMKAGVIIGSSAAAAPVMRSMTYDHEVAYRDDAAETPKRQISLADTMTLDRALAGRATVSTTQRFDLVQPTHTLANVHTGLVEPGAVGGDVFAARQELAAADREDSLVVPAYELELLA